MQWRNLRKQNTWRCIEWNTISQNNCWKDKFQALSKDVNGDGWGTKLPEKSVPRQRALCAERPVAKRRDRQAVLIWVASQFFDCGVIFAEAHALNRLREYGCMDHFYSFCAKWKKRKCVKTYSFTRLCLQSPRPSDIYHIIHFLDLSLVACIKCNQTAWWIWNRCPQSELRNVVLEGDTIPKK